MKTKNDFELGQEFTFENAKRFPVHRWFYYKEGFSPKLIDKILRYKKHKKIRRIFDPFAGVGTSLLRAKELDIESKGVDVSPLSVFVTSVKVENHVGLADKLEKFIKNMEIKSNEIWEWRFELFNPKIAFPKSNYEFIVSMREKIENMENEKIARMAMLALLSIIPQTSYVIKDGGVLRINKRKRTIPAKKIFRRKIKQMIKDIKNSKNSKKEPKIMLGDAKELKENNSLVISSPPYVNAIDYSKVYGMELSLLGNFDIKRIRSKMISSSIYKSKAPTDEFIEYSKLPIVQHYLKDMKEVIENLVDGNNEIFLIVSNALIHNFHVEVDRILAEIMEDFGYKSEIIIGKTRKTRIDKRVYSIRESAVHGYVEG